MATKSGWTRQQLLAAFSLYCQLPFGRLHARNPEIVALAKRLGRTPSALAMKLNNIAGLDPSITGSGRKGLSGASAADRAMWAEMQADWDAFAIASQHALESLGVVLEESVPEADKMSDADNRTHEGSTRKALVSIRIRQDFFRRSVLSAYGFRCCITGLSVPKLLVASHIIPWSVDAKNRLNPRNGLCLSALHDKAFDAGLLTVNEDMTVRVSRKGLGKKDTFYKEAILAYDGVVIRSPAKLKPEPEFLDYHRQYVFEAKSDKG